MPGVRFKLLWLGGAVALAAVVVVALLHVLPGGQRPVDKAQPSAPPLTSTRIHQIESDVVSGDEAALRDGVEIPQGQQLAPKAIAQLKSIGSVSIDLATFHRTGPLTATAQATVQPAVGRPSRWSVQLVFANHVWRIAGSSL